MRDAARRGAPRAFALLLLLVLAAPVASEPASLVVRAAAPEPVLPREPSLRAAICGARIVNSTGIAAISGTSAAVRIRPAPTP